MTEAELALRSALDNLRESEPERWQGYTYRGLGDFLLQHGQWFELRAFPDHEWSGLGNHCFGNAICLAASKGYRYVEGVAIGVLDGDAVAAHHGWNIDHQGNLIDSTWMNTGVAYLGVEFSLGRADHDTWEDDASILDNPTSNYELYRNPWHGEDFNIVWPESEALTALRLGLKGDNRATNTLFEQHGYKRQFGAR